MHKRYTALAAVLALLPLSAKPSVAETAVSVLVKSGATIEARAADLKRCEDIADNADDRDLPAAGRPVGYGGAYAGGGVGAVAGAAVAGIIIGLIEESEARGRGQEMCMYNLGYRAVPLIGDEAKAYAKLPPAKKRAWETEFLATDLSARLAPLMEHRVPRLPEYRDGPMQTGGFQFDGLVLAAPQVQKGDDLLKGTLTRWRTATLVTPIETEEGPVRVAADAGTVFHQVDYRRQREPLLRLDGATWCGPVRQLSNGISAKDFYCFVGRDNGYEVFRPSGQPWLAGPYLGGFALPLYTKPIELEERTADDLGPIDFRIKIVEVTRGHIQLAAEAMGQGKTVRLWLRELSWDKAGKAVLPLWDKRLVLTRGNDKSISAELTNDGDGTDWRFGGTLLY